MPTCKVCGKPLKGFRWYAEVCGGQCAKAAERLENQQIVDRLSESPSHCQATVTDVVAKSQSRGAQIGDFFVSTGGLVLVFYTQFPSFPQWSEGVATLAGGVGAGLGMAYVRMKEGNTARGIAAARRAEDIGLSVEERLRRHGGMILLRDEIRSVESDPRGQMIRLRHSNGVVVMAVTNAGTTKRVISEWVAGTLQDEEDTLLVNSRLPQVGEMLAWIEDPSKFPEIKLDDCTRAANATSYCEELVKQLKKRRWRRRERLCQLVKGRSARLASSMGSAMAASLSGRGLWNSTAMALIISWGFIGAMILGVGELIRLNSTVSSSDYSDSGLVMVGGAGLAVLAAVALSFVLRDRQRNKQLAGMLSDQP